DIFGAAGRAAGHAPAAVGPSGTKILPGASAKPASYPVGAWKPAAIGLAALLVILGLFGMFVLRELVVRGHASRAREEAARAAQATRRNAAMNKAFLDRKSTRLNSSHV